MVGARLGLCMIAASCSLAAAPAFAADYTPPCYDYAIIASGHAPPGAVPCYVPPPPPVVEEFSGWYLRGDIGFSNQSVGHLFNANYANFTSVTNIDKGFESAGLFAIGIGYNFNDWLRFDVTGEYRGASTFHGLDVGTIAPGSFADDRYVAIKTEWTFLLNGYVDLGTWYNVTPFVGAGVGFTRNTISNFGDFSTCVNSVNCAANGGSDAYGGPASKWNFAWALHAGLAYRISPHTTLEFAYRYIDLGDAQSGDVIAFNGVNTINNPMEFHHLTSNDFKFGVRFDLDGLEMPRPVQYYAPPPQYYAPPPVYSPPPVYTPPPPPPPLRSRG